MGRASRFPAAYAAYVEGTEFDEIQFFNGHRARRTAPWRQPPDRLPNPCHRGLQAFELQQFECGAAKEWCFGRRVDQRPSFLAVHRFEIVASCSFSAMDLRV